MVTKTTPQLSRTSETDNLNVRWGPSTNYHIVGEITDRTSCYEVLGKYHTGESGDIGTWWQIVFNDTTGWVRGDLVTLYNVDDISPTWQPYTARLRTGSLALPFAEGIVLPITSLFDDPRRGQRDGTRNNGTFPSITALTGPRRAPSTRWRPDGSPKL